MSIKRTTKSNPIIYIRVFDLVKNLYLKTEESKQRGYKQRRFSFNFKMHDVNYVKEMKL